MMPQAMPEAIDRDGALVHKWRAAQLRCLGIPEPLAEVYADRLDWHQVARLVRRGCPPVLASASSADAAISTEPMTTGTNWRDDAACLDADPDLFFPIGTTGPALGQIDQAKRICLACRCGSDAWRGRWSWAQPLASGEARPTTSGAPSAERPPATAIAPARRRFTSNPRAGCADHQG